MTSLDQEQHNQQMADIDYRKVHLAVMATENAALRLGVSSEVLFDRLEKHGLVENGLLRFYEMLHTQSLEWVTDWLIEALLTREKGNKEVS